MKKTQVLTQDDYIRTALRLPRDLHAKVRQAAEASGRTMNAELIARIADAEDRGTLRDVHRQNVELKALMRELLDAIELLKKP